MGIADRHYERADYQDNRPPTGPWQSLSISATMWLIGIHVLGYFYCAFGAPTVISGPGKTLVFSYDLAIRHAQLWRLVTYILAEDNLLAVFINLFTLFFTARLLEMVWGWRRLVLAYLAFALAGGLAATLITLLTTPQHPYLYGPSAPIVGLLIAAIVQFNRSKNSLVYTNSPLPLTTFLAFMIIFQAVMPMLGFSSWLSLVASIGAGLAAFLYVTRFAKSLPTAPQKNRRRFAAWFESLSSQAPVHAVRPGDKTQAELARDAEILALEAEVDRILDKVRNETLASLTEEEKRTLQHATDLKNQNTPRR